VPFPYYRRLNARQKRIYRASDRVTALDLREPEGLRPEVERLRHALVAEDRKAVERSCAALSDGICGRFGVPPIRVRVLAARPSRSWGELHGLYDPEHEPPLVTLWMRTAAKRRVVAFKSFLRTLVHELLHHLDYELLELEETFHTEGFFRRESSLVRQMLPAEEDGSGRAASADEPTPTADPA